LDYSRHYQRLIDRARERTLSGYSERHHVVPRCMGGGDEPANIVRLTAEEHFVAHQLLVKMHPGNHKLMWALSAMTHETGRMGRRNKRYGWLRRRFAEMVGERSRGQKASPEARAKMSAARLGVKRGPQSAEHRAKLSAASKGKPKSLAHRAALSKAKQGISPKRGDAWRVNQEAAMRRVAHTRDLSFTQAPEYRAAQSAQMKRVWADRRAAARNSE
jgi:hypothetical protein